MQTPSLCYRNLRENIDSEGLHRDSLDKAGLSLGCTAGQHLESARGHLMPCLSEQVTPTYPLSPVLTFGTTQIPPRQPTMNLVMSLPETFGSRALPSHQFGSRIFLLQLFPWPSWLFQGLFLFCNAPFHPCVPQIHRVSNWPAVFSLPCLYKQEAGTKTTISSPPASTQALGRTGSMHSGESHSLVDSWLVCFSLCLYKSLSTRGGGERVKSSRKTLSLTTVSSLLLDKWMIKEMETILTQHPEANHS